MESGEVTRLTLLNHSHQANSLAKYTPYYKSSILGTNIGRKGRQRTTLAGKGPLWWAKDHFGEQRTTLAGKGPLW